MTPQPKFKAGDKVTFTNEYGLEFPGKTVIRSEVLPNWDGTLATRYHVTPTDSPWVPMREHELTLATPEIATITPKETP